VCFYCHRKIHDYPQAATARGLLASLGADLAAVTELRRNGGIR
jgi:hypothetical protein